jgi:tetratricopeptide (TPR) repeat protein
MFRLLLAVLLALAAHARPASADARAEIAAGIAWLHSFEYERALTAFERAEKVDPRAPMAYWGQAMCYEQFLWGNENVQEARRILARARANGALERANPQERAWLSTLAPLFGEGDRTSRVAAFAAAMSKVASEFPGDPDVASIHGLAILATRSRGLAGAHGSAYAGHGEPQLVGSAEQQHAATIFERVLAAHPKHPGALHYLIHTWDDPAHAHKALAAARVYPSVAPESSHARHMPAHVFVQLGMWPEAIASDEAAAAAADAKTAQDGLPVTAQDFHPLSWLVYEYTQAGRFDDARRAVERVRGPAETTQDPRLLSLLATLRSRVAVEERNWQALPGPNFVNYDELFAVGFSAAHRGDTGLAERARMRLGEMAKLPRYEDRRALLEIMALQVGAALRARTGDMEVALGLLADATRAEAALPSAIGPPALIKPAQEQYAELLLEAGRAEDAAGQFEGALARARNRRVSTLGLEQARTASADADARKKTIAGGAGGAVILLILLVARRRRAERAKSKEASNTNAGRVPRAKSRDSRSA